MKLRLVQDSYTKKYVIEYWEENTIFSAVRGEIVRSGYWTIYRDPLSCRLPDDPDYVKVFYSEDEFERAKKDFEHLVNKYSSKTIVIKEADTNAIV